MSHDALDAFVAVAEPRRRKVLDFLMQGERPVNDVVDWLGLPQPQVSKHLSVLRDAGLVSVRRDGRRRLYSLNAERLRTVHEWVKTYERFWSHQLARIKERAERNAAATAHKPPPHFKEP